MRFIEAIYQDGVFRPIHPVQLPEGAKVEVSVIEQVDQQTQPLASGMVRTAAEPLVGEDLAMLLDQLAVHAAP